MTHIIACEGGSEVTGEGCSHTTDERGRAASCRQDLFNTSVAAHAKDFWNRWSTILMHSASTLFLEKIACNLFVANNTQTQWTLILFNTNRPMAIFGGIAVNMHPFMDTFEHCIPLATVERLMALSTLFSVWIIFRSLRLHLWCMAKQSSLSLKRV